jgi:hypothetical protein
MIAPLAAPGLTHATLRLSAEASSSFTIAGNAITGVYHAARAII